MSPKRKTTTLPRRKQTEPKQTAAQSNRFLMVLVLASIAVVIIGIVQLKASKEVAQGPAVNAVSGGTLPADQLNLALAQGQPTLVFMHSTNCQSCIDMMKVVDQVFPEFAGQVTLVDVNVYDDANVPLMQELGLRYIPTVVVFDSRGQSWQNVGLMQPDAFRTFLRQRALGG